MAVSLEIKPPSSDCISAGRSLTKKRTRIAKSSMSAESSAVSLRKVGGDSVLGTELCPSLVDGDRKCIEADLGSDVPESAGVDSRVLELAMLDCPDAVFRDHPVAPCSKKT